MNKKEQIKENELNNSPEVGFQELDQSECFIGYSVELPYEYLQEMETVNGDSELDKLWNRFHEAKSKKANLLQDDTEIGVMMQGTKPGYFSYFAGGKAKDSGVTEDFQIYEVTKGNYVVCHIKADDFKSLSSDALFEAQKYVYDVWLKEHQLKTEGFCMERYQSHNPQTTEMELWLKLLP